MPVTSGHFIEIEETPRIRQLGDSEEKKTYFEEASSRTRLSEVQPSAVTV